MFDEYKRFSFPFRWLSRRKFRFVGSCNGLVCFSDDVNLIWNPVIRKAIRVPRPNFTYDSDGPSMHSLGFGFDSATNDYKIVRIVQFDYIESPIRSEVEVYSLSTGSWRSINHKAPMHLIIGWSRQAYVCGAVHWLTCTIGHLNRHPKLISEFDMRDEIFREMHVPESLLLSNFTPDALFPYECQESISLLHFFRDGQRHFCMMWVMKEYNIPESWVKQFTFDCIDGWGRQVGVRSNGEVLVLREGNLLSYDYKNNKFSDLAIRGDLSNNCSEFFVGSYTESLALLDKGAEFYDVVIGEKYCEEKKKVDKE